jgi:lysophospholipid acyltransferase (LPLAT)-like uncharacterized protein
VSLIRRALKSTALTRFACWLGAQYIRLVLTTNRWQTVRGDTPKEFWESHRPFILAIWHGRMLMMPRCWPRKKPIHMLASHHRDGRLIAETVAYLDIGTISGSSSSGGAQGLRAMLKILKSGECVGLTPDGPRGPRMRAAEGVAVAAKLAGVPIIPATYSVSRGRYLDSWDRFLVAWPFGRGVIVWGQPIHVARDADGEALEVARLEVETALNAITVEADRLTNRSAVAPAELEGSAA